MHEDKLAVEESGGVGLDDATSVENVDEMIRRIGGIVAKEDAFLRVWLQLIAVSSMHESMCIAAECVHVGEGWLLLLKQLDGCLSRRGSGNGTSEDKCHEEESESVEWRIAA